MAKKQDFIVGAVLLCIMFVVLLIADLFFRFVRTPHTQPLCYLYDTWTIDESD
jgi:hypothetical protein